MKDMQLIDSISRKRLRIGDLFTVRDQEYVLTSWKKPHKPASQGFVYVAKTSDPEHNSPSYEFYASVIGAEFYPRPDRYGGT